MVRPVASTGIEPIDALLSGGLPIGAVTEMYGPECSGRTSSALSFVAQVSQAGKVCAWIDVSNTFDPPSAASNGVDLKRLLWVRCGARNNSPQAPSQNFRLPEKYLAAPTIKKGLHGGGFGPHPRTEANGLSTAVAGLLSPRPMVPCDPEPQPSIPIKHEAPLSTADPGKNTIPSVAGTQKPWPRIEQALRSTDLLIQSGGFSVIVLDMGSLAAEYACRVPLATWHRYRLASERTQSSILLLTQHPCAKSSAELLLHFPAAEPISAEPTVFTGIQPEVVVVRQRFPQTESNVVSIRKPPRSATSAVWQSRSSWAGQR